MSSKDRSSSTAYAGNQALLSASIIALLAGSVLLFASAAGLNRLTGGPKVQVDFKPWAWLGQIHLGLDQLDDTQAAAVAPAPIRVSSIPVSSELRRSRAPRHHRIAKLIAKETRPAPLHVDEIHISAAASTPSSAQTPVSERELETMRNLTAGFRHHFFLAVRGVSGPVNTQVAQVQPVLAPVPARAVATQVSTHRRRILAAHPISRALSMKKREATPRPASIRPAEDALRTATAAAVAAPQPAPTPMEVMAAQVQTLADSTAALMSEGIPPAQDSFSQGDSAYAELAELSAKVLGSSALNTQSVGEASSARTVSETHDQPSTFTMVDYSKMSGYSAQVVKTPVIRLVSTQSPAPASTQPQQPNQPSTPTHHRTLLEAMNALRDSGGASASQTAPYIEAFDWQTAISDASGETLTTETPDPKTGLPTQPGWREFTSPQHWPTLAWRPQYGLPLISHNTALMLAGIADAKLQADTGIVFGKLPEGWTVSVSGRAENVVLLDTSNHLPQEGDGDRYFAFLNCEPGAHVLSMTGPLGTGSAALGVPVLSGIATYTDLSHIVRRSISGRVLDASAPSSAPVRGATVSLVGRTDAIAITGKDGEFRFENVYVASPYPVHIETDTTDGYKHRYQASPETLDNLQLFRMNAAQIQAWTGQLEGGISSESGMVVAAAPSIVAANAEATLFPALRTLQQGATLVPESYTLSGAGQLEVNVPLKPEASRFISLQIPEGLAIATLEDNNHRAAWSELVVAQPGVINVLGPY